MAFFGRLNNCWIWIGFELIEICLVHTMDELKFTGNSLKGSRPFLSFDAQFDSAPHYRLMKETLKQVRDRDLQP